MTSTHASDGNESTFVSVREAAPLLGVPIWDVYQLVKRSEIAYLQNGPHAKIRILASDIPRWKAERAEAALRNVSA
jgi:excisionase family DNA binding protein